MSVEKSSTLSPYQVAVLDELLARRAELETENVSMEPTPRSHRTPARPVLAGAGLAIVIAGALAGVASLGGHAQSHPVSEGSVPRRASTPTLAAVAYRTTGAITQAQGSEIEHVHDVETNASGADVYSTDVWRYEGSQRIEVFGSDGSPELDDSHTAANGTTTGHVVDYQDHSWFPTSQKTPVPLACDMVCRTQRNVADGFFDDVTRTTLDGVPALELSRAGSSSTLWVDPASYLPIQVITRFRSGGTDEATFTWLMPTSSNLALLQAPIPAGFTELPGPPQPNPASSGVG
jgi:hypothetical protein